MLGALWSSCPLGALCSMPLSYRASFFQGQCLCEPWCGSREPPFQILPAQLIGGVEVVCLIHRLFSSLHILFNHYWQSWLLCEGLSLGTQISLSFALGWIRDANDHLLLLVGQTWARLCLLIGIWRTEICREIFCYLLEDSNLHLSHCKS